MSNKTKQKRIKRNGRFILWYVAYHKIPIARFAKATVKMTDHEFILYCLDGLTEDMTNSLYDYAEKIVNRQKRLKGYM